MGTAIAEDIDCHFCAVLEGEQESVRSLASEGFDSLTNEWLDCCGKMMCHLDGRWRKGGRMSMMSYSAKL